VNVVENVIIFVVLLGVLIMVHELGHFILAKRAGVKVEEFAIGFPPRLATIRRGETDYSINLIPLGGYVRMLGEEDPSAPRSFAAARRWWRVAILAAGATMNILLAIILFGGAYAAGWPMPTKTDVVVLDVLPETPAAAAGLQPGDVIRSFAGVAIAQSDQLRALTSNNLGKPISVVVIRNGQTLNLSLTPRSTWPSDQGPMGVAIQDHAVKIEPVYYPVGQALVLGAGRTIQTVVMTVTLPIAVMRGLIPADEARPVGPVGIYQIASQASTETVATGWWFPILSVAGTISAGLGVANLLPIPGLDGGRLLFVLIEALRGRRISPARESMIHFIGLAFLVSAVLVVTYFDVLFPTNIDFGPH
jgi:regulator of sigma E protease